MNNTTAAAKKVIFNAPVVAARLNALRAAAVEAGEEESQWWKDALTFEWSGSRKGNNGTQWSSVNFKDDTGVSGRLIVRINSERHTGTIMPSTDEGLADMATKVKNPKFALKKRDKKPSIQVQKWAAQVKTAEDGITLLYDDDGEPILPGDDKLSPYFQVALLVGEAFTAEAKERVDRGLLLLTKAKVYTDRGAALLAKATAMKKLDKAATAQAILDAWATEQNATLSDAILSAEQVATLKKLFPNNVKETELLTKEGATAQAVLAAFAVEQGARRPGDMILSSETVAALRKIFANPKDTELLTKGAIITSNVKIANLVQDYIGSQAAKNAGQPLPNPMTRLAMNFDQTTGIAQMAFFDKDQPFMEDGRQKYDTGKVDGDPVNADNIHKFIVSRSTLDGIVNMDSVCFSNMGISMPVKAEVLVVAKPSGGSVGFDDVYDDDGYGGGASSGFTLDDFNGGAGGEPEGGKPETKPEVKKPAVTATATATAKPAATTGKPAATTGKPAATKPAAKPVTKPAEEENYDDLLNDLSATATVGVETREKK
jgi:hypothetical protein